MILWAYQFRPRSFLNKRRRGFHWFYYRLIKMVVSDQTPVSLGTVLRISLNGVDNRTPRSKISALELRLVPRSRLGPALLQLPNLFLCEGREEMTRAQSRHNALK